MDKYTVVVNRERYYEVKNAYVRWDDYGGGDSDWRGGKIHVFGNPYGREIPESVKEKVLEWCEHWLPTDRELYDSPGWTMEFEIKEWRMGTHPHAYVSPKLTDTIQDLMRRKAAKEVYAVLK